MLQDGTLYLLVARGFENGHPVPGGLYRSYDGAENWIKVGMPEDADFPNDLCFNPDKPQQLFLACWPRSTAGGEKGGGLYVTDDNCESWRLIYNRASHVYGAAMENEKKTIFICTFEGKVLRSDDMGRNWEALDGFDFKWAKTPVPDPVNKGMLYVTTFGSSVWHGPYTAVP